MSPYRISLNFGEQRALDIGALTKLPGEKETIEEYLSRVVKRGPQTILPKLCDRLHNVRTLRGTSRVKRMRTLAETKRFHIPILLPALRQFGEEWKLMADQLESKIMEAIRSY